MDHLSSKECKFEPPLWCLVKVILRKMHLWYMYITLADYHTLSYSVYC